MLSPEKEKSLAVANLGSLQNFPFTNTPPVLMLLMAAQKSRRGLGSYGEADGRDKAKKNDYREMKGFHHDYDYQACIAWRLTCALSYRQTSISELWKISSSYIHDP
ncbi:hypothetical protein OWV82_008866 [Melia azedarach]|uniref:Uncharacterized protein n=1 Tax=Melia azedarach TaxID=155640 RepID=A0ACC1YC44_MELAZ|nr:hypothetical protein OWV82_008866 [Melia azedarach]